MLWNTIRKPIFHDDKYLAISDTTKDTNDRDLTVLFNNIYLIFDLEVANFWVRNQPRVEIEDPEHSGFMFNKRSPTYLMINFHDDVQGKFTDKMKRNFKKFLNDNRGSDKEWYDKWNRFGRNNIFHENDMGCILAEEFIKMTQLSDRSSIRKPKLTFTNSIMKMSINHLKSMQDSGMAEIVEIDYQNEQGISQNILTIDYNGFMID